MEPLSDEFVFSNEQWEDLLLESYFTPPAEGLWKFVFNIHYSEWGIYVAPVTYLFSYFFFVASWKICFWFAKD